MKPWMMLFSAGWLANSAFRSLHRDALGQEKYSRLIDDTWICSWITVPVAIIALVICFAAASKARKDIGE
jgi:hypothetical protein